MWDDRFLFVTAALIAIAVVLEPRLARMQRTVRFGRRYVRTGPIIVVAIALLVLLVVGSHIWSHWGESVFPNATSLITLLIGATFGAFTAHFVASQFGAGFGRRDPLIGAAVAVVERGLQSSTLFQVYLGYTGRHRSFECEDAVPRTDCARARQ